MGKLILGGLALFFAAYALLFVVLPPPPLNVPSSCIFADLPDKFVAHGAGAYGGDQRAALQIDAEHKTMGIDVHVTETNDPVLLVLTAYDPVLWSVRISEGARIVGALVVGYHSQAVTGLPSDAPLVVSTYVGRQCGFYASAHDANEDLAKLMQHVQKITRKRLETFQTAYRASDFVIGPSPDSWFPPKSSARLARGDDPLWRPHRGHPALDAMIGRGALRRPTQQEIDEWVNGATEAMGFGHLGVKVPHRMAANRTYVVERPAALPSELPPGHAIALLVPTHVDLRRIDFGQFNRVQIYHMRDYSCSDHRRSKCH